MYLAEAKVEMEKHDFVTQERHFGDAVMFAIAIILRWVVVIQSGFSSQKSANATKSYIKTSRVTWDYTQKLYWSFRCCLQKIDLLVSVVTTIYENSMIKQKELI